MSIFKNLFGNQDGETGKVSNVNWIQITDLSTLDEIQESSFIKPAIIFKHSTTCSISRMALKNFEREYSLNEQISAYFLDLLNYRAISTEIAARFDVIHQSPQLLLIKDGKSIYDVSHDRIDAEQLALQL